jgi:hypothetical protein
MAFVAKRVPGFLETHPKTVSEYESLETLAWMPIPTNIESQCWRQQRHRFFSIARSHICRHTAQKVED